MLPSLATMSAGCWLPERDMRWRIYLSGFRTNGSRHEHALHRRNGLIADRFMSIRRLTLENELRGEDVAHGVQNIILNCPSARQVHLNSISPKGWLELPAHIDESSAFVSIPPIGTVGIINERMAICWHFSSCTFGKRGIQSFAGLSLRCHHIRDAVQTCYSLRYLVYVCRRISSSSSRRAELTRWNRKLNSWSWLLNPHQLTNSLVFRFINDVVVCAISEWYSDAAKSLQWNWNVWSRYSN